MRASANSGVYAITHEASGKRYIGSSRNMRSRLNEHRRGLVKAAHFNVKLQNAVSKHGIDAFTFEPLIRCAEHDLILFEQRAIDGFDSCKNGYNIRPTAESQRGHKFGTPSDETRAKIRASNIGIKKPALIGNTHTLGMKHSDETKAKMSKVHTGAVFSEERCAKIAAANRGRVCSSETKAKISATKLTNGVPPKTAKWKAVMAVRKGCKMPPFTEEHRLKMSIAAKARKAREKAAKGI